MAGFTVEEALNRLIENPDSTEDTIRHLDKSFEKAIEREILSAIRWDAVLIIFLSLVFLYISRMTKKLQNRNVRISRAESLRGCLQNIFENPPINFYTCGYEKISQ